MVFGRIGAFVGGWDMATLRSQGERLSKEAEEGTFPGALCTNDKNTSNS